MTPKKAPAKPKEDLKARVAVRGRGRGSQVIPPVLKKAKLAVKVARLMLTGVRFYSTPEKREKAVEQQALWDALDGDLKTFGTCPKVKPMPLLKWRKAHNNTHATIPPKKGKK